MESAAASSFCLPRIKQRHLFPPIVFCFFLRAFASPIGRWGQHMDKTLEQGTEVPAPILVLRRDKYQQSQQPSKF